ncbi:PCNA-interacting partner isoform X3 [Ascaphus truei]|uniref:PCNA-interacting partner isoform X3 n=1 Tax=Ascaphus truei TaxID=8439 RepID=UPI003F59736C
MRTSAAACIPKSFAFTNMNTSYASPDLESCVYDLYGNVMSPLTFRSSVMTSACMHFSNQKQNPVGTRGLQPQEDSCTNTPTRVKMSCHHQNVLNLLRCFRRQWSLVSECERTTVCSADNMLLILQLAMAEVNKKNCNEFSACLSDVLLMWKHFLKDKLGLVCEDSKVPENYADARKTYDLFLKNSNSLDLIDLYKTFSTQSNSSETNGLSSDQLLEFLAGGLHCSEESDSSFTSVSTPSKNNLDNVKVKGILKRIFCAYLSLLMNSRNDFALAQILNCPDRGLGREAFTDLKHTARNAQMSLFLMATSFIRTVEFGGKGYAPSESDPLRKHIKGLSQFVHFVDKLNEVLGETENPRTAGELILSTIKMHLIKGRGSGDPVSLAAAEVAQDLDLRIKNIINLLHENGNGSTTGISPARPRIHAINRGTASCGRETVKALLILLDEEAANPLGKNKAELLCADEENNTLFGALSILTLYRSPEQCSGSSPDSLNRRLQKCINKNKPKLKQNLIRSQFACTYKDDNLTKIKPRDFPSMSQVVTCIHPARKIVPVLCFDEEPLLATDNVRMQKQGPELSSGNIDLKNVKGKGKSYKNLDGRRTKRKQVDVNSDNPKVHENEPPQKKAIVGLATSKKAKEKQDCKLTTSRNGNKSVPKNKLIAGQAKLTSFFRM